MKFLYTTVLSLIITNKLIAQTNVVQDTKGETGLALGTAGVVAINAKDESISFSYGVPVFKSTDAKAPKHYMGASAKGKGKNGLAAILKNDEFQYDGNIGLFYFTDWVINDDVTLQWHGSADFLFNQFKLFDSSASIPFSKQVYDQNKSGYKLTVGANLLATVGKLSCLGGLSFNGGNKNNTGDLKAIEVATYTTMVDPLTLQTRIIQKDKSTAYSIKEYKPSLGYFNINMDLGAQVFKQGLLMFHPRWSVQEERKPQFNPAIGLYFTKSQAPLDVVAGIQLQVSDWANTAESIKTRKERTVVNIVAGFSF